MVRAMDINDWNGLPCRSPSVLIDLRERKEFRKNHLPGAVSVPYEEALAGSYLPKGVQKIYVYCLMGQQSYEVAVWYSEHGYEAVDLLGGIRAYRGKLVSYP